MIEPEEEKFLFSRATKKELVDAKLRNHLPVGGRKKGGCGVGYW